MTNDSEPQPTCRLAILGSTGSIGRQTVDVVRSLPERFEIVVLVAGTDDAALRRQSAELRVADMGLGEAAALEAARRDDVDVVLNAIVGAAGLKASVAALEAGKILALANKESLVAGGEVCLAAAARGGGSIVAVDSEHAAIAQCLEGRSMDQVERVILTASGGPFRTRAELDAVTPEEALAHPTWSMGPKITVDSATMMNKGLEVIEAHHLFGLGYDRIDVLVHPQSLVHGMVEFVDGSMLMQASPTDMRIPIQAALTWPQRVETTVERLDLARASSLGFEPVDRKRFPLVDLAYEAGNKGGSYPAALNAADEIAVASFLAGKVSFTGIAQVIEGVLAAHDPVPADDLAAILEVDAWARREAQALVGEQLSDLGRCPLISDTDGDEGAA